MGLEVAALAGIFQIAGTAAAGYGAYSSYQGQKAAAAASKKAEDARQRQMELDALMKQRKIIRDTQLARAKALSAATQQGAGEGSGLPGGYGQIQQTGGEDLNYLDQSRDIGRSIFDANRAYTEASSQAATGKGLFSFGVDLIQASPKLGQIGVDLFGGPGSKSSNTVGGNPNG